MNIAAVIPTVGSPLEIREAPMYEPGPGELLLRNELIALHPVEAKMFKLNIPPIQYPAIIGISFGGTVTATGADITKFAVGDKVAAFCIRSSPNEFGSFQKYVLVKSERVSPIRHGVEMASAVSCIGNLGAVVGLLSGRVGIPRPDINNPTPANGKNVLIYGGTSSFGSLAAQYAALSGYTVVTTTSSKHDRFVSELGASYVVNHEPDPDAVIGALNALGPFDVIVDSISLPPTLSITSKVLEHQGGGKLYTVLPAFGPENLPDYVTREFDSWTHILAEDRNANLQQWAFNNFLSAGLASGKLKPHPTELVSGGLRSIEKALDRLHSGVSGVKLLIDPQETSH